MNFSDVPVGSTFYTYIHCIYCQGVISGFPDGTFRPNANVTRGQLSKIVIRSAGLENGNPGSQLFQDVQPGSTFYTDVNLLAEFGYISGYPCGGPGEPCSPEMYRYFRPSNPATRAQISKIVAQTAGWNDNPGSQMFADVPPSNGFYAYVQRLALHNAISGYPCGGAGEPCVPPGNLPYFRPDNLTTRGQLSKIDVYAFYPSCVTLNN
jgi:5'-nucleotidase/2',3'-cyclic-nucleotide 2'-phosphodiesterase/3'-nucleotidase/5'-nucleotidase